MPDRPGGRFRRAFRILLAMDSQRDRGASDANEVQRGARDVATRDLPMAEAVPMQSAHDEAGAAPEVNRRDRPHRDRHPRHRDGHGHHHRSRGDGHAPPQPRALPGPSSSDQTDQLGGPLQSAGPTSAGASRGIESGAGAGDTAPPGEVLRFRERGKSRERVEYFDRRGKLMKALVLDPDEVPRERSSSPRRHNRHHNNHHHHDRVESQEEHVEPARRDYYEGPARSRGPGPVPLRAQYARPGAGVYDDRAAYLNRSPRVYDARQYPQGSPRAYDARAYAGVYDGRAYAGVYDDHAYLNRSPRLYDARQYPQGSPRAYDARAYAGVYDGRADDDHAYRTIAVVAYDDPYLAYLNRSPRLYDDRQYPQGSPRAYDDRHSPSVWDEAAMAWARVPGSSSPRSPRFGNPPPAPPDAVVYPASPRRRLSWSGYPGSSLYPPTAMEGMEYPQGLAADWMPKSLQRPSRQQTILPLSGLGARSARIGSPVLRAEGDRAHRRMTKKLSEDILRERELFSLKSEATSLKNEVDQHNRFLYTACRALQKQIDVMYERISDLRSKSPENQVAAALEGQIDAISQQIDVIYHRVSDKRSKSHENLSSDALQDQINAMSKRVSDLAIYATNEQGLSTCSMRGLLLIYADNRTCIAHTYRTCRGLPRHSDISHYLLNVH